MELRIYIHIRGITVIDNWRHTHTRGSRAYLTRRYALRHKMIDRRSGNFSCTVTSYLAIRNRTAYDIVTARLADGIQQRLA